MSTNDLVKESSLFDTITSSPRFPSYMEQLTKSCQQQQQSSPSSMTPAQQQILQKTLPHTMRFWNSRNFINATNGGGGGGGMKESPITGDFLPGGATSHTSGSFGPMPPVDLFSQDFASLPALISGANSIQEDSGGDGGGGGVSLGSGRNIPELDTQQHHETTSTNHPPNHHHHHHNHHVDDANILRGFSEPCLLNADTNSVPNDSRVENRLNHDNLGNMPSVGASASASVSNVDASSTNKLFTMIMEHIQQLHDTNSKICRNLHETKVDIEALKYTPSWNFRHRRDSISGLSTHSQPVMFGGGGFSAQGSASPYSGAYNPGMMTDIVREVKDAARVREDALINRVKSLVEERQWSLNEYHLRIMRDLEDIKSQLNNLYLEKKETNKRITHLEDENRQIWQLLATLCRNHNASNVQQIVDEHLNARLQRKSSSGSMATVACSKCASSSGGGGGSTTTVTGRHLRLSGIRHSNNNNNGYAVNLPASSSSPPNFAIISPTLNNDQQVDFPVKGPRPSSSHEGHSSLAVNRHSIHENTTATNNNNNNSTNEHETRAIVLGNVEGGLIQQTTSQSAHRRHETTISSPSTTTATTTLNQFINGDGHMNTVSGQFPVKYLTTASISPSNKRTSVPALTRDNTDVMARDSFMHSHSILINNNNNNSNNSNNNNNNNSLITGVGNSHHKFMAMEMATVNTNSGTQSKLSIAGPITDL